MKQQQRGGTVVGVIIGAIIGLAAALAVAVYVTKVPVPFLTKSSPRTSDQDEAQRNKNWDPNAPLYGKTPARPQPQPPTPPAVDSASSAPVAPAVVGTPPSNADVPAATASRPAPARADPNAADPLAELTRPRAKPTAPAPAPASGSDPFDYFVQAGAFRTPQDADAQRAKLAMLGWEARVSEREQSGRTVFRVRVGPFNKRDDAESLKQKLDGAGVESALVRVQR